MDTILERFAGRIDAKSVVALVEEIPIIDGFAGMLKAKESIAGLFPCCMKPN